MENLLENLLTVEKALNQATCTIIKNSANKWSEGNSSVTSSPIVDINKLFSQDQITKIAVNFVSIKGKSEEPLHYHTAHLVGVILKGEGFLLASSEANSGSIEKQPVTEGDVIIIPRNIYHFFEPLLDKGEIEYIALEFSDKNIDYQKHYLS